MRKSFFLSVMCIITMVVDAQTPELFKPYKTTDLRLPSVPIVVNDPYFSVWSPFDKLNEGPTRHWTNADKPMLGLLRVDGITYRFMGSDDRNLTETLLPMADEETWLGKYSRTVPKVGWEQPAFDEEGWKNGKGAFGSDMRKNVGTYWGDEGSDIYVRRTFNLSADDLMGNLQLKFSHDDMFELYINGIEVVSTGNTWKDDEVLPLTAETKSLLRVGVNVIAMHGHNTVGGAYADCGLNKDVEMKAQNVQAAQQKSVDVLATNTYFTFACGPVDLNLVFTAPMLIKDFNLLSTPVNYISYQVHATDGKQHKVEFYLATTPEMCMNNVKKGLQPAMTTMVCSKDIMYAKAGTIEQPILAKKGDGVCIDWGYLYLAGVNGEVSIAPYKEAENNFTVTGKVPCSEKDLVTRKASQLSALAYVHDFGEVGEEPLSAYTMIGYDEVQDIEYLYHRYKGYWTNEGKLNIFDAFSKLKVNYLKIMDACRQQDKTIYDDGMVAGNKEYAEILSGSYRQVIAAHKLFKDNEGNLLFFSKENNSNGSVNTVDLTYPEAPLFLAYNPELQKAMMTSIFNYSLSGRWIKPFTAHDMGTYPIADGQTYGGDMPLEECGNMITLAATLCIIDGNTKYVDKYWDLITEWVQYLVENGQDPANQLCTDDFAGHWAHNCNLSAKAIMGILGYSQMAAMKGLKVDAKKYQEIAKTMAAKWEKDAKEKDHYRLAYDRANSWSQKYNMVWDRLWNANIFPNHAIDTELRYYLGKQNIYGLPLDSRKDYTKSDWIMWTASMAKDKKTFLQFVTPVYKYINETPSRVPISDWHDTKTGKYQAFIARSVIGGYWMKVLMDKMKKK